MAIDKLKSGALNLQDDVAVDTDTLFVDVSTDRVGIGTASPSQPLHVEGTVRSHISSATSNFVATTSGGGGFNIEPDDYSAANPVWKIRSYSNEDISVVIGGIERARFLNSGGLTFNGDTAAANALDDYEEGTWEMTVTDGTTSNSSTGNTYRKVGNLVFIRGDVQNVESGGAFSGQVYVSGLPFSTVGVNPISSLINYTATSTAWSAQVSASGVYFYKIGVTGSDFAQLQGSDLSYYSDISISGCYAVS